MPVWYINRKDGNSRIHASTCARNTISWSSVPRLRSTHHKHIPRDRSKEGWEWKKKKDWDWDTRLPTHSTGEIKSPHTPQELFMRFKQLIAM